MVKNEIASPEQHSQITETYKCEPGTDCENYASKNKIIYQQLTQKDLLSSKLYNDSIDSEQHKESEIDLSVSPNSDFSSMLSGHLTEMTKVRQQGHQHASKYSHQHSNLPRGNVLELNQLQYSTDMIFDECFDLEEFVLGQPSLSNPQNNFISTQQLSPLVGNMDNNICSDSGRSSSQSSNDTDHNINIDPLSVWLDQTNMPANLNDDHSNMFRHFSQPVLDQPAFVLNNKIPERESTNHLDKNGSSTRSRDCSLSNDSGVEGCGFFDPNSKSLLNIQSEDERNVHPSLRRHASSSSTGKRNLADRDNFSRLEVPQQIHYSYVNSSNSNNSNNALNHHTVANRELLDLENSSIQPKDSSKLSENKYEDTKEALNEGMIECIKEENTQTAHFSVSEITLDGKNASKKTAYNEKWGVKVLKAWCLENCLSTDFELLDPVDLNSLLCRFWAEVRKSNGDYYGRNSLFNLRAMINKHLKGKPFCINFDIVTDDRFRTSNERLEKQLKLLKGIGRTITHKQPISISDLRKMYDSGVLGTSNPIALLRKVWFEVTLHFCHKGAEAQEKLKKTSFHIYKDLNGRKYVARTVSTLSDGEEVRMYETGGELCPVKSYELYLKKLHSLQARLFQQPRRKSTPDSPMWYGKAPIGEKALQQMMANISTSARLSKRYTNHCVRTTALEQFSNSRRKNVATDKPRKAAECANESYINASYTNHHESQHLYSGNYTHMSSGQLLNQTDTNIPAELNFDQNSVYYQSARCGDYRTVSHQSDDMNVYAGHSGVNYEHVSNYSPPSYNDQPYLGMSPPAKRPKVDGGQSELMYANETPVYEYNKDYLLASENQQIFPTENKEIHRFLGGQRPFVGTNFQSTYNDESGTGRSLLSPISLNGFTRDKGVTPHYPMQQDTSLLSRTIVAGSDFDLNIPDEHCVKPSKYPDVPSSTEFSRSDEDVNAYSNPESASLKSRFHPLESDSFNNLPTALSAL